MKFLLGNLFGNLTANSVTIEEKTINKDTILLKYFLIYNKEQIRNRNI